jgi:hypothetical protein
LLSRVSIRIGGLPEPAQFASLSSIG